MNSLAITVSPNGTVHCLYSELIDLREIGTLDTARATAIEFNSAIQQWEVRSPIGELLYTHHSRASCLAWELNHFNQ